jgi:hypothetical protein
MTDKTLANLIGEGVLPEELVASLEEAFQARVAEKVAEAREEAELAIREELAQRYEHDKDALIEAMDKSITDVVQQYESQKAEEIARLQEAQEKFHTGLKEAKATYRTKLKEHLASTNRFIAENLAGEVKGMRAERKNLAETRVRAAQELAEVKAKLAEAHNAHVKKIDEFVVNQVSKELNEFAQDRRALVETRAKFIAQSRKELNETKKALVKESAEKLDRFVSEQVAVEMKQLHEDLERNRKNQFGRRIFEAMAAEFSASYYSDGTEAKKIEAVLETVKAELAETKQKLAETAANTEVATRKARLAEDRAQRSHIMSELLSNLRGEKRAVMEGMLESVKTPELRKSFERLLPVVLNETAKKPVKAAKVLNEETQEAPKQTRVVTGDQRSNRLVESIAAEVAADETELAQVVRLAGIKK